MTHQLTRDNTYNSENDLSSELNLTVYGEEGSDWCWADDVYVAICVHKGGDVRGNYGGVRIYRADSLADTGFFDWVMGWTVEVLNTYTSTNDTFTCWDEDESLTEQASPGYHGHPSSYVYDIIGTDNVEWRDGQAYGKLPGVAGSSGVQYRFTPYHYNANVETPEDGDGWLCDAQIDVESFLKETLGEPLEAPDRIAECWDWSDKVEEWIDGGAEEEEEEAATLD
jgi:hypothetical protein